MSSSNIQKVQRKGIYHGLPVYDDALRGLTAIITGANGISGHYMLRVLSESPDRWSKIYCLSRRPPYIPGGLPKNAEHIAVDFMKDPAEIAEALKTKGVTKVDHVFFFAYLQPPPKEGSGGRLWSDSEEMVRVNKALLDNFLGALKVAQLRPKRFMLQTGAKNYGVHQTNAKVPLEESDPRVEIEGDPNFYYFQEDSLWEYCEESGGETGWNIAMPGPILGGVPDAAMNLCFPLAVYAAVTRELGDVLKWPATEKSWTSYISMSSAMVNAYLEEWSVLTPEAKNQKFNACDNSAFAWQGFWPRLAGWYGLDWEGPGDKPFSFVEWVKQEKVRRAWKKLAEENDLLQKELVDVDRVFGFADGSTGRGGQLIMSMDKAGKLGWHGFVDTQESILAVFDDFARIKMIPPVPKVKVQFN